MDPIVWAGILLTVGLLLAGLEIFIPSGGLLGFFAVSSLIAAVAVGFWRGLGAGVAISAIIVAGLPVILGGAVYLWPRTPMGRRFLLTAPTSEEVLPEDEISRELQSLVGQLGQAKTLMLPSGVVQIQGKTFDAVSEGQPIEAGDLVKVVELRGRRLIVREATAANTSSATPEEADELLSRPIESLGLDTFSDPIA